MQLLNLFVPVLKLTEVLVPKLNGPIGKALTEIQNLDKTAQAVVSAVVTTNPGLSSATAGASGVLAEIASMVPGLQATLQNATGTTPTVATVAAALIPALQEVWSTVPTLENSGVTADKIPGLVSGIEGLLTLL